MFKENQYISQASFIAQDIKRNKEVYIISFIVLLLELYAVKLSNHVLCNRKTFCDQNKHGWNEMILNKNFLCMQM